MAEKDPLAPLPDPWQVPDDYPVFSEPPPPPPDPAPPPGKLCCPHCGVVFASKLGRHTPGDWGVCGHCGQVLVFMDNGHPRLSTYDEAVEAESDPRVRLLQMSFGKPLPES